MEYVQVVESNSWDSDSLERSEADPLYRFFPALSMYLVTNFTRSTPAASSWRTFLAHPCSRPKSSLEIAGEFE